MSKPREDKGQTKARWLFKFLAPCVTMLGLAIIDVGLRTLGLMPPQDPLVFHLRSHAHHFSPFVEADDAYLTIKPEWINREEVLLFTRGKRSGRYFLYPGFRPCRITKNKSPNTIRIFILGGSTTFGLYVGADAAFPAVIEKKLRGLLKDRDVDVINLGCPGLPNTRVANLLDTVLTLDPDLVIVYAGHNEMLEGNMDDASRFGFSSKLRVALLSISSIFAWANYAVSNLGESQAYDVVKEEVAALEAGKILVYDPLKVPSDQCRLPSDEFLYSVASSYGANVQTTILKAREARVPIMFVLPISNLLVPPAVPARDDSSEQMEVLQSLVVDARHALKKGRIKKAMDDLDRALELSPRHAMTRYLRGCTFMALGYREQALAELQIACDFDFYMMHRITSQLESAMIRAVEGLNTQWVDLRSTFRKEISVASSQKLFVDHCHPTKYGHRLIAEQVVPCVMKLLGIDLPPGNAVAFKKQPLVPSNQPLKNSHKSACVTNNRR